MLSENTLAQILHETLRQKTDGFGLPTQVSNQTKNYAAGIIAALKAGSVSNAPGTITGITAPGAPLAAGAGVGGIVVASPDPMLAKTGVGVPPQALIDISKENVAIIAYLITGLVVFAPGTITGNCTSTPVSPGPLVNGAGTGGLIVGLNGPAAVAAVSGVLGKDVGPDMLLFYSALMAYITASATVTYPANSIIGVCPPASAVLAGAGTGGIIS